MVKYLGSLAFFNFFTIKPNCDGTNKNLLAQKKKKKKAIEYVYLLPWSTLIFEMLQYSSFKYILLIHRQGNEFLKEPKQKQNLINFLTCSFLKEASCSAIEKAAFELYNIQFSRMSVDKNSQIFMKYEQQH